MKQLLSLLLVATLALTLTACGGNRVGGKFAGPPPPRQTTTDCGATKFSEYRGPLLPLVINGADADAVSVSRNVAFDLSALTHANVRDSYTLTNNSDEAVTLTIAYPFVSSFYTLNHRDYGAVRGSDFIPSLSLRWQAEGEAPLETRLSAGIGGRFLTDWHDYAALLANADLPWEPAELNQAVTVYEFRATAAATASSQFSRPEVTFDHSPRSQVLSHGSGGGGFRNNRTTVSFFAGGNDPRPHERMFLYVIGDKLTNIATCSLVNPNYSYYESTLGEEIFQRMRLHVSENELELRFLAVAQTLNDALTCSETWDATFFGGRISSGSLEDLFGTVDYANRVFYAVTEITLPPSSAGESVEIIVSLIREGHENPSHCCAPSATPGLYGYDLLFGDFSDAEFVLGDSHEIVREGTSGEYRYIEIQQKTPVRENAGAV
jgi:hypothetical protein